MENKRLDVKNLDALLRKVSPEEFRDMGNRMKLQRAQDDRDATLDIIRVISKEIESGQLTEVESSKAEQDLMQCNRMLIQCNKIITKYEKKKS